MTAEIISGTQMSRGMLQELAAEVAEMKEGAPRRGPRACHYPCGREPRLSELCHAQGEDRLAAGIQGSSGKPSR